MCGLFRRVATPARYVPVDTCHQSDGVKPVNQKTLIFSDETSKFSVYDFAILPAWFVFYVKQDGQVFLLNARLNKVPPDDVLRVNKSFTYKLLPLVPHVELAKI